MTTTLSPLPFLRSPSSTGHKPNPATTGLVILNTPIPAGDILQHIWQHSSFHICADGGANRLHDFDPSLTPSLIHGDLDSLRPDVRDFYTRKGVDVSLNDDQYSTDLAKCVGQTLRALPGATDVVVLGSLGGRVDHGLGLVSELGREALRRAPVRLWLVSEQSISFVLLKGKTGIEVPLAEGLSTQNVGIMPAYGLAHITIEGFEWDVQDWEMEMGGQVSSSNHLKRDMVTVETDKEVLFTVERRQH
ncbi:hypothetical protein ANO11243_033190 [Dothideomycetidae sp. 11243]|nr:hypothetical protein ANO11243_033190 [fungal sp. No.11243]